METFAECSAYIHSELGKFVPLAAKREGTVEDRMRAVETYARKVVMKEIPEEFRPHLVVTVTKLKSTKSIEATVYDCRTVVGRAVQHRDGAVYLLKSMNQDNVVLVKQGKEFTRTLGAFARFYDFVV